MSNYTIETTQGKHNIIEKPTGHKVGSNGNKRAAHKKLAFLNMGGAFDGWTPSFFLIDVVIPDVSD